MKILAIDDEYAILESILRMLPDHEVVLMRNSCEAIEHLRAGANYDCIICDILMPDCTGVDVYRAMLTDRPLTSTRMVFLTGGGLMPAIVAFLDSVKNPRLEKPFSKKELHDAVFRAANVQP